MKYGFVTIAAAVPHVSLGDCGKNVSEIINLAKEADRKNAALAVFPELSITGATCGDLFLQAHLAKAALEGLEEIRIASRELSCAVIVGLPFAASGHLYDCAAVIHQGRIAGIVPKTNFSPLAPFSQGRYFSSPEGCPESVFVNGEEVPFGTDLVFRSSIDSDFCFGAELGEDLYAPVSPSCAAAQAGALVIANLSASPEGAGRPPRRLEAVKAHSGKNICTYVFANAGEGESTADFSFSGHCIIAENGRDTAETKPFACERLLTFQTDIEHLASERRRAGFPSAKGARTVYLPLRAENTVITRHINPAPFIPSDGAQWKERCSGILTMQAAGLRRRLRHTYAKTAVIGISGGLDSTLALLVTCEAFDMLHLDRKGITAVTLPCFGTTDRTKNNAYTLCEELGVELAEINIKRSVKAHFEDIGHDESIHDVTYENGQARERTQVLMDLANKKNGMVIGTGDLSELALGWATYNGDHMSMYGVNASIPKTLVRHLVEYYAQTCGSSKLAYVLRDILDTPVSPELLPPEDGAITQKTEDIVGPYALHDFFIFHTLRSGFSPAKVFALAKNAFEGEYEPAYILKWLRTFYRRFFMQQFKRSCLPDGAAVGSVSLSPRESWHMPSDALSSSWLREVDSLSAE